MTQISDPIVLTALGAIIAAIAALWARSERLITDRDKSRDATARLEKRLTHLIARLSACPLTDCPFRAWSHEELAEDPSIDSIHAPSSSVPCCIPAPRPNAQGISSQA